MSLPHALLTALAERSCSGSELATRFDKSIAYFWSASHQQIYRELAQLEQAGLIESLPEEATRGRKRAYRILSAGRAELRRWIMLEEEPAPLRHEFMVRLRAEAVVGPTRLEAEIRRRIAVHTSKLAQYREIAKRDFPDAPEDRETALHLVVLEAGIGYESGWLEILDAALAALQKPQRASRSTSPRRPSKL
jgi:DNA-binding PadR family transcriptional regulator